MLSVRLITLCVLALIAIVDWRQRTIWHAITIPGSVLAIVAAPWQPAAFLANAMLGAAISFTLFFVIHLLAVRLYGPDAFGFGDVMLGMLIGAIGGVYSGLLWLACGMLLAGLYAALIKLRAGPERSMAYGTFLAIAAAVGLMLA